MAFEARKKRKTKFRTDDGNKKLSQGRKKYWMRVYFYFLKTQIDFGGGEEAFLIGDSKNWNTTAIKNRFEFRKPLAAPTKSSLFSKILIHFPGDFLFQLTKIQFYQIYFRWQQWKFRYIQFNFLSKVHENSIFAKKNSIFFYNCSSLSIFVIKNSEFKIKLLV